MIEERGASERRAAKRYAVALRAAYVSRTASMDCHVLDISTDGAFIHILSPQPVGAECELVIFSDYHAYRFRGHVTRQGERPPLAGVGIRFEAVADEAQRWLEGMLSLLETRR